MLSTNYDTLQTCALEYRRRFHASARRVLRDPAAAQDAVQDAMVSAIKNLPRFRGDSQMSTWMGRIVINQAISRRRVMARRPESSLDTVVEGRGTERLEAALVARTEPGPERQLLQREASSLVRAAIEELPPRFRTVVIMRHFEGAAITEIAGRLGVTQNATKLRLIRARRLLRRLLADRGYERPAGRL